MSIGYYVVLLLTIVITYSATRLSTEKYCKKLYKGQALYPHEFPRETRWKIFAGSLEPNIGRANLLVLKNEAGTELRVFWAAFAKVEKDSKSYAFVEITREGRAVLHLPQ